MADPIEPVDPAQLAEIEAMVQGGRLTEVEWTTEQLALVVGRMAQTIIDLTESIRALSEVAFGASQEVETLTARLDRIER